VVCEGEDDAHGRVKESLGRELWKLGNGCQI
jgi:hypothetical protein